MVTRIICISYLFTICHLVSSQNTLELTHQNQSLIAKLEITHLKKGGFSISEIYQQLDSREGIDCSSQNNKTIYFTFDPQYGDIHNLQALLKDLGVLELETNYTEH